MAHLSFRHPSRRTLMAFHDGEVDEATAAGLEAHVEGCERCAAWLDDLQAVGALARGEIALPGAAPALPSRPVRRWALPPASRLLPALAAVTAVVLGVVTTDEPSRRSEQVATGRTPPGLGAPPPTDATPPPGDGAGTADASGAPRVTPATQLDPTATTSPPGSGAAAGRNPGQGPLLLGLLVPSADAADAADDVVAAAQAVVAAANTAGGVGGRELELLVDEAGDPGALDRMEAAGVDALVGGYGVPAGALTEAAALGLAWFGPADGVESTTGVVPVEVPHRHAGAVLATAARATGVRRAVAITTAVPERQLADGVGEILDLDTVKLQSQSSCVAELQQASQTGARLLVLAADRAAVATCLSAVPPDAPIREVLVPATAVDEAREHAPRGLAVSALAGLPLPGDDTEPGVRRFEKASGARTYRALVAFVATEMALDAVRHDGDDPYRGFVDGGRYTSDLIEFEAGSDPPNRSARVVHLGSGPPTASTHP